MSHQLVNTAGTQFYHKDVYLLCTMEDFEDSANDW